MVIHQAGMSFLSLFQLYMNVFLKNEWFFDFLALKTFSERSSVDLRTQELEFGHSVLTLAFRKSCFMAWKTGRTLCAFYCTTCFQIVKVYFNTLSHFSNSEIFQVYYFKLRCNTDGHHPISFLKCEFDINLK